MKFKYVCDSHTHSRHSFDGKEPISDMCISSAEKGLYAITITDHCEINGYYNEGFKEMIYNSYNDISKLQQKINNIKLYKGIELGQPLQDIKATQEVLSAYDFDFVLASLHNLTRCQDFYYLDYNREDISVSALLTTYFNDLYEMAVWNEFDSLAHLTYPLRYIVGDYKISVDLSVYADYIDMILKTIISNGKSLEINTSGLRQSLGETLPNYRILNRFKELGGEYITIGSDAHICDDIGKGIEQSLEMLLNAGFKYFAVYENRKANMLPIYR